MVFVTSLLSAKHRIPTGMNDCTSYVGFVHTCKVSVQLITPRKNE